MLTTRRYSEALSMGGQGRRRKVQHDPRARASAPASFLRRGQALGLASPSGPALRDGSELHVDETLGTGAVERHQVEHDGS